MLPAGCRVVLRFEVVGKPEPGGSKRGLVPLHPRTRQPLIDKRGRVVCNVVDANENVGPWKRKVAAVARVKWGARPLLTGALGVMFIFRRVRPKAHFGTGRNADRLKDDAPDYPTTKPDALKLTRAVEDALTQVVWVDDAQIVHEEIRKEWASEPGVQITIATMPRRKDARAIPLPGLTAES